MNAKEPSNPAAFVAGFACASPAEAAAVESLTEVRNIVLGGPFDPSELSSAAAAVKPLEIEKCATATSPTAMYDSKSDDDNDDGKTMPRDQQAGSPQRSRGSRKLPTWSVDDSAAIWGKRSFL